MENRSNRYEIRNVIAKGGMAEIYLGYDKKLDREVAIKFIKLESNEKSQKRFYREAEALSALSHPNIVRIYDYGEINERQFIAMDYLPKGTLRDQLGKKYSYNDAAKFLLPVAKALAYAHQKNIIHRDLKPSNLLFGENDELVVSDFGIAKLLENDFTSTLTTTGMAIGTPEYMSPEQARGEEADQQSDIYSLGIILYEMVTGKKPFEGKTPFETIQKQIKSPLPTTDQFIDLPDEVKTVILKATAKGKKDRYQTMQEFLVLLDVLAKDNFEKSNETAEIKAKPQKQKVMLIGLGLVALIAISGILITNLRSTNSISSSYQNEPSTTPSVTSTFTAVPTNTPIPTPTLGIGSSIISEKDGMEMMLVPEGEFLMGASEENIALYLEMCKNNPEFDCRNIDQKAFNDQTPQRTVYMDAFWIDKTEVTNAMYQKCVDEGACLEAITDHWKSNSRDDYYSNPQFDDYPMTRTGKFFIEGVTGGAYSPIIFIANMYCNWAGKRLPTEAEWEKAARGTDGRIFPWGNDLPTCDLANVNNCVGDTTEVGSYPAGASPYGVLDMTGNVAEWVLDDYLATAYQTLPSKNPNYDGGGFDWLLLRGGGYMSRPIIETDFPTGGFTTTSRNSKNISFSISPRNGFGFRCAKEIE